MHIFVEVKVTNVDGASVVYTHQGEISTACEVENCLTEVGKIVGDITLRTFSI
jgi:hypothetical protein